MSEFEEKLNSILSDPGQMEKISRMASKLMGGEAPQQDDENAAMPDIMAKLGTIMSRGDNDKTALLRAMEPYISGERRQRLRKAMQLAKAATIARTMFSQEGGNGE